MTKNERKDDLKNKKVQIWKKSKFEIIYIKILLIYGDLNAKGYLELHQNDIIPECAEQLLIYNN